MILLFLPALYAVWFRIKPSDGVRKEEAVDEPELQTAMAAE